MDKILFETRHVNLYFNTLEIGFNVSYIRRYMLLSIRVLVFELQIVFKSSNRCCDCEYKDDCEEYSPKGFCD